MFLIFLLSGFFCGAVTASGGGSSSATAAASGGGEAPKIATASSTIEAIDENHIIELYAQGKYEEACDIYDQRHDGAGIQRSLDHFCDYLSNNPYDDESDKNFSTLKDLFNRYSKKYKIKVSKFYGPSFFIGEYEFIKTLVDYTVQNEMDESLILSEEQENEQKKNIEIRTWIELLSPSYPGFITGLKEVKKYISSDVLESLWFEALKNIPLSWSVQYFDQISDEILDKTILSILNYKVFLTEDDKETLKLHKRTRNILDVFEEHFLYDRITYIPLDVMIKRSQMISLGLKMGDDFYTKNGPYGEPSRIQSFGSEIERNPQIYHRPPPSTKRGDLEFSKFWATYFSTKHLQEDLAISAVDHYINMSKKERYDKEYTNDSVIEEFYKQFNILSRRIKDDIKDLFSVGYLKERSDRYKARTWSGFSPLNEPKNTKFADSKNLIPQLQNWDQVVYYKQDLTIPPQDIIIETYGGYSKNMPCQTPQQTTSQPLSDTMMSIGVYLGDCDFDIHQSQQLKPEYFEKTHALLLKRMSDYIKFIKTRYPTSKIYLKGGSFGGFFATSYTLLASNGVNATFYNDWARTALQKHFGTEQVTPIDGAITDENSIFFIGEITKSEALNHITIPILVHHNYDDERTPLNTSLKFIKRIPVDYLYFSLSRHGALPFMSENISARGHTPNPQANQEFNEAILHFIDMVHGQKFGANRSEFSKNQTLRRLKLANPELESEQPFTKKDVEQFLSNLRYMEISKNRSIDEALKLVNVPKNTESEKRESYDKLMSYVSFKIPAHKRNLTRDRLHAIRENTKELRKMPERSYATSGASTAATDAFATS